MAGYQPLIHGITYPTDTHHSPCGRQFDHHSEVIEHERECSDCKVWIAIRLNQIQQPREGDRSA